MKTHRTHVRGIGASGFLSLLVFGVALPVPNQAQVPSVNGVPLRDLQASAATLETLSAQLDSLSRLLAAEIQASVEANVRPGADPSYARAEVNRILESRRVQLDAALARMATIRQGRTGQIMGRVTGAESGRPVAAALVSLGQASVLTNAAGEFTLTQVLEGTHTVSVQRIGFEPLDSRVSVIAGSTMHMMVELGETAVTLDAIVRSGLVDPVSGRQSPIIVGRVSRENMPNPVAGSSVQNLQGQNAGVRVVRGAEPQQSSAGRQPLEPSLIVIDGRIMGFSAVLLGQRFVAGVALVAITPSLGGYFGVESGVLVTEVTDQSPGADAGLVAGDVLLMVAGSPVSSVEAVRNAFAALPTDDAAIRAGVPLTVVRERRTIELRVPRD